MKYVDINKRFTEIVSEYIAKGYTLNTASMNGSEGEITKVDLTDGKEILRVLLTRFHDSESWHNLNGVEITIGRVPEEDRVTPPPMMIVIGSTLGTRTWRGCGKSVLLRSVRIATEKSFSVPRKLQRLPEWFVLNALGQNIPSRFT